MPKLSFTVRRRDMSDLLTRLEAHRAAGHASPGFHLSDEDMDEIIRGLRAVRPEPSAPRQHTTQPLGYSQAWKND